DARFEILVGVAAFLEEFQRAGDVGVGYRPAICATLEVFENLRRARDFLSFVCRMAHEDAFATRCVGNGACRIEWAGNLVAAPRAPAAPTSSPAPKAATPAAAETGSEGLQHGVGFYESIRRGSRSDLVNARLHGDAGIGHDAGAIEKQGAVDAADFIFTI